VQWTFLHIMGIFCLLVSLVWERIVLAFLFSGFELCLGNWRVGYVRSFNCEVADCIDAVTFTECLGGVEMGKVDVVNSRPKQPGLDGPSGC
jgi:hypothetical protein